MTEPKRISPEEVHQKLKAGKVLLVCAYEDEAKFKKMRLQGAISFNEFKSRLPPFQKTKRLFSTEPDPRKGVLPVRQPSILKWDTRTLSASRAAWRHGKKQATRTINPE